MLAVWINHNRYYILMIAALFIHSGMVIDPSV